MELFILGRSFFLFLPFGRCNGGCETRSPLIDTRLTFITRENRLSVVDKIPIRRDSARIREGRERRERRGGRKLFLAPWRDKKGDRSPPPLNATLGFRAIKIKSSLSLNSVSLHSRNVRRDTVSENLSFLAPPLWHAYPRLHHVHPYTNFIFPSFLRLKIKKESPFFVDSLRKIVRLLRSRKYLTKEERRVDSPARDTIIPSNISWEAFDTRNGIKYRRREKLEETRHRIVCLPRCGRTGCRPLFRPIHSCPVTLGRVARETRRDASVAKIILPTGPWKILPSLLLFRCAWESSYSLISLFLLLLPPPCAKIGDDEFPPKQRL